MCGISVLVDPASTPAGRLLRMHAPIRRRGPDGEGLMLLGSAGGPTRTDRADGIDPAAAVRLGLAFRRLRILDLSEAAAQPMASPDGSCWLVFNGEIYNFRELRKELESLGHTFRSSGDSEVALAAFGAWGTGCFERFEGMWAIVIADLPGRRLVASRDRFGIKPLYWRREGERLLLASEIRQILAASDERPRADTGVTRRFLLGSLYPRLERTFFEGVREVPPATWFEWPLEGAPPETPAFRAYWRLEDHRCDPEAPAPPYPEALEEFSGLFERAVASHEIADVPVGGLLSGGLDSAAVVGVMARRARAAGRAFPTFSFGFRAAAPEVCELPYVDAMARGEGLVNRETTFDAAWVAEHAPRVLEALEEPTLAMPALAQYRVFELCRTHGVTVVFDGQGADEILGGYPYYERILLVDRLRGGRLREFGAELRAMAERQARGRWSLLSDYLWRPLAGRLGRRPYRWLAAKGAEADPEAASARAERGRDPSALNRQLHFDVKRGNVRVILAYADKSAMAHSIEARVPYFDRRLVEYAFRMPDTYKVGRGERKRLLRDTARRFVTPEITERRDRMGFGVPEARILRGGLWPAVREEALGERLCSSGLVERGPLARFVEDFEAGRHDDHRALWRLYALATWAGRFGVTL